MSLLTSQLWIGGSPRDSSTQQTYDVINSASQSVVGRAARATSKDVKEAIEAANQAQPLWEALPAQKKRDIFIKASQIIQSPKYVQQIVEAVQLETAAQEVWGYAQLPDTVEHMLEAAKTTSQLQGEVRLSERLPGGTVITERIPLGTVFVMVPSNAPVLLAARAIMVPLACGNAVVLKSSEFSPRCATILVEALYEAGLPSGVISLIHIAGEESPKLVAEIIGNKNIKNISFTGSDRVGKILAAEAAKYLKPCVLELGGNAAIVVLNDANVEEAARNIISSSMFHSGQICLSGQRVIVQRDISEKLIELLTNLTRKIHAGSESTDQIPPLGSISSAEKVLSQIQHAHEHGAKVIVGDIKRKGPVVQPHVVVGVEPGMPLWDVESFGPVVGVKVVDTEEEAITFANATEYSLGSALWTRDMEKGLKLARNIRVANVVVNGPSYSFEPATDISGYGGRTGYGMVNIENFTHLHTIALVNTVGMPLPVVGGP